MSDGDYLATYQEVRNINNLDSDSLPDDVLDEHLNRAQVEVESFLRTDFDKTTQPSFSNTLFNSRDLYRADCGAILYFQDFKEYNFILTIDSVEYRSSSDDDFETLDEGDNDDYVVDTRANAIKFTYDLARKGFNNLRVSGTYGYTYANAPIKYKQLIALIAALQSIVYASGGSYSNVDSHTIGNVSVSKGQYAPNLKQEYTNLIATIEMHLKTTGLRLERSSPDMI